MNIQQFIVRLKGANHTTAELVQEVEKALSRKGVALDDKNQPVRDSEELPEKACAVLVNGQENTDGAIWVLGDNEGTIPLKNEGWIIVLGPPDGGLAFWGLSHVRFFRIGQ